MKLYIQQVRGEGEEGGAEIGDIKGVLLWQVRGIGGGAGIIIIFSCQTPKADPSNWTPADMWQAIFYIFYTTMAGISCNRESWTRVTVEEVTCAWQAAEFS